jgi:hypothetical protein
MRFAKMLSVVLAVSAVSASSVAMAGGKGFWPTVNEMRYEQYHGSANRGMTSDRRYSYAPAPVVSPAPAAGERRAFSLDPSVSQPATPVAPAAPCSCACGR